MTEKKEMSQLGLFLRVHTGSLWLVTYTERILAQCVLKSVLPLKHQSTINLA